MYIEIVPNRKSRPTILLREGHRDGKKVNKQTLSNLTNWPAYKVEALRRLLKGEPQVQPTDVFVVEESVPHGHVEAILGAIHTIGLEEVIASKPCRERDLVVAMIVDQLIHPCSKLGYVRLWPTTTLAEELEIQDADEDDLYEALDWLFKRQHRIEKKLARRHLGEGVQVFYDVTSSYYEGVTCPLARFGNNRDGKKDKKIIVYGLMCDAVGRPIAVEVYPGNTADPITVPDQVEKLRKRFHLESIVLVGDRGMLTQTQIDDLKRYPGLGWISALRFDDVRKLADHGKLQMTLFDRCNLAEIISEDFPGERLVVCYNPFMAEERSRKRRDLLEATEKEMEKIMREVARRRRKIMTKDKIGLKVGKVIGRFKMGKHFELTIEDGSFSYRRREESIRREEELDGIYVIRTSEPGERLSPEDAVRSYKNLSQVERMIRSLKGIEILVRPIRHRAERRVRAHIFLCILAYYVEWHMRKALAPLLFDDEELDENKKTRDPVAPAKPSRSAKRKKRVRVTSDGLPVHSFRTLLEVLSTRTRNRCRVKSDQDGQVFFQVTPPTPVQLRALQLLGLCSQ